MGACRAIRCGGPVSTISPGSVSDQNSTRASCRGVSMEDADATRVRCMGPDTAWHLPCSVYSLSQVDLEVYFLKHYQMPLREQGIWLAYIQTVLHWVTCLWTGTRWLKVSHDDHSRFCLETAVIEAGVASVRRLDLASMVLFDYTESETGFRIWTVCLHTVWAKPNLDLRIRETAAWSRFNRFKMASVGGKCMFTTLLILFIMWLVVKSLEVDKKCFHRWCLNVLHLINLSPQWDVSQQVMKAWLVIAAWIRFHFNLFDNKVDLVNQTGFRSNSVSV